MAFARFNEYAKDLNLGWGQHLGPSVESSLTVGKRPGLNILATPYAEWIRRQ